MAKIEFYLTQDCRRLMCKLPETVRTMENATVYPHGSFRVMGRLLGWADHMLSKTSRNYYLAVQKESLEICLFYTGGLHYELHEEVEAIAARQAQELYDLEVYNPPGAVRPELVSLTPCDPLEDEDVQLRYPVPEPIKKRLVRPITSTSPVNRCNETKYK